MDGLVDREAILAILDQMVDPLRTMGMTFEPQAAQIAVTPEGVVALCPILIRDSAKEKLTEDRAAREEFTKIMQSQHKAQLQAELDEVKRELLGHPSVESSCKHDIIHPDGFCIECGVTP